jgi:DNA-binding winged helix-turn-helix (wHTH) protein
VELLFADHTLDPDRRELHCGPEPIAVEPQVFDLLIHLIRNRDRVVSKDDLIASVWDGPIVSEPTLTSRINAARKAIGDSGEEQKLIRTIARRGFRFVGRSAHAIKRWRTGRSVGPPRDELHERSRPAVPPSDRPATEAIVAAIEPQLYARESFRAQRKPPDNMNAWDLVMRGLSHYWRVTRQDNVVAQTLLEKAIAIDPNYGQALGVLATSYTFSFHMGWADRATAVPIAERAALAAIRADGEDLWAHHARFEEADQAVRRALPLSPRDPFSAIFTGIAAYSQSLHAITTRRCGWRARPFTSAAISPVATACSPPLPAWPDIPRPLRPRSRSCAARSPISHSPGSRTRCRSCRAPNWSTIWKPSAAPV